MEILFLAFTLETALTLYGQGVVFQADVDIFLANARNFDFEHQLVFVLKNINWGKKARCRQLTLPVAATGEILKETVHAVLKSQHVAIGIPASNCHTCPPKLGRSRLADSIDADHSIEES